MRVVTRFAAVVVRGQPRANLRRLRLRQCHRELGTSQIPPVKPVAWDRERLNGARETMSRNVSCPLVAGSRAIRSPQSSATGTSPTSCWSSWESQRISSIH